MPPHNFAVFAVTRYMLP